jgi:hypothetical protein
MNTTDNKSTSKVIYTPYVQLAVRNKVLEKQVNQINKNEILLENVDIDLNTMRRQAEIVNDSALRKTNHIFLLKTLLTFVGLSFIPVVLKSQDIISNKLLYISLGLLFLVLIIIIYFNLMSFLSRTSNRYNVRNFSQPDVTGKTSSKFSKCARRVRTSEGLKEFERKRRALKTIEDRYKFIPKRNDRLSDQHKNLEYLQSTLINKYQELEGDNPSDTKQILKLADELKKQRQNRV